MRIFKKARRAAFALVAIQALMIQGALAQQQAGPVKTLVGKVTHVVNIGGESTGVEIELDGGRSVEADFNQIPGGAPEEGAEVQVQGRFVTVIGVERGAHKVFVVTNLMPPVRALTAGAAAAAAARKTITGTIIFLAGIGGESTGTAIQTGPGSNNIIEADFSKLRLGNRLPQGQVVQATGTFETVDGVERGTRQVFVVKFFLQQLEGVLFSMSAIGGETTGVGLRLKNNQSVELDLRQRRLQAAFREGAKVQVAGMFKSVPGVEIPMRDVLIVRTIQSAR